MIYLIATADELELPLATAGSLNELAGMCKIPIPKVCRIIKENRKTKAFMGIPAKIYKFMEDD